MKIRAFSLLMVLCMVMALASGCQGGETPVEQDGASQQAGDSDQGDAAVQASAYPSGKLVFYGYGQPQFYQAQFELWFEQHPEATQGIEIEMIQAEGAEDVRKKVTLTYQSGALDDLPDVIQTQVAQMRDMAKNGILTDVTDYLTGMQDELLDGVTWDVTESERMYGLPISFRPQVLYYNTEIFERYEIDPARMDTMEGYVEVGREIKKKSDGEVYLSFASPSEKTWSYWGRRGLMPQAQARIFDDDGNVVFGENAGTKLAMGTLDTLFQEDLLLRSQVMQPPLYDSIRNDEVATFYIGAFWDEFLRKNTPEIEGKWRLMTAPMYEEIGLRGAPVTEMFAIIEKPEKKYEQLYKDMWYSYMFDADYRNEYANQMERDSGPCWNPLSKSLAADDFWKSPDPFYGGQSFKEMETVGLIDAAPNMYVTSSDVEADAIISDELDKYIAGDQDMDTTIARIDELLKTKIGTAK